MHNFSIPQAATQIIQYTYKQ